MVKHIIEYNVCVGDEVRFERMDGMFQYVSKGDSSIFPYLFYYEYNCRVNSFRCFLLYLVYRYKIGKIWL